MRLSHCENLPLRSHSSILLNSDRQRFKLISFFFLTHCKTNRLTLRKNKREESRGSKKSEKPQKKTRRKQLLLDEISVEAAQFGNFGIRQ